MRRKRLRHMLITVPAAGGYLHSYVICRPEEQQRMALRVLDEMMTIIEQERIATVMSNISLSTTDLDAEAIGKIEKFLREENPRFGPMRDSMKNFHRTTWSLAEDSPDNKWLMELH